MRRRPSYTDELVVSGLVKLRLRLVGEEMRLTQAEAQALYLAVLPQNRNADPEHVAEIVA